MSNVRADGLLGVLRIGDERRARQAGREDIHHHRKTEALVARVLRRAAERGQEPALLFGHQRIVRGAAFAVQQPAVGSGEVLVRLVADTARGDRRRCHIEQERHAVGAGGRE
jgi:hypothetical protein